MMQTKYDIGQEVLVKGRIDSIKINSDEIKYFIPILDDNGVYTHRIYEDDVYPMQNEQRKKVDHPDHYNQPGKKECIEQMLEAFGDDIVGIFCYTNAYKYLYRAGCKDGESKEDDMAKAKWYMDYAHENCVLSPNVSRIARYVEEGLEKYENSQSRI